MILDWSASPKPLKNLRTLSAGVSRKEPLLNGKARADGLVGALSWDQTWSAMNKLIVDSVAERRRSKIKPVDVKTNVKTPFDVKEGARRAAHV